MTINKNKKVLKEEFGSEVQVTYKAITVVTGLTTVYCNTPSLHLNSKTLQRNVWILLKISLATK